MANKSKWKRVLVTLPSGDKAYRYTDGKGNYRHLPPAAPPETREARHGLTPGRSGPPIKNQLEQMAGPAGGETRTARVSGKDTRPESQAPAAPKPKPKPKPKPTANVADYKDTQGNVYDGNTGRLKTAATAKPSAPPKPSTTPKPVPKSSSKPIPKSSSKPVSKTSESYKDGGKGLYQGSQEYRDKIGGSGNPLLNRLRRDMGRDEKTGEKPNAIPKNNSPASKRGSTPPTSASKSMTGGSPYNTRGMFDKDKEKNNRPGSSYA